MNKFIQTHPMYLNTYVEKNAIQKDMHKTKVETSFFVRSLKKRLRSALYFTSLIIKCIGLNIKIYFSIIIIK